MSDSKPESISVLWQSSIQEAFPKEGPKDAALPDPELFPKLTKSKDHSFTTNVLSIPTLWFYIFHLTFLIVLGNMENQYLSCHLVRNQSSGISFQENTGVAW